jgi:hypothetical protein
MNCLPTRRRLSAAVLVLASAAIFATGCGDTTDTTDTTSTAPSTSSVSSSAESSGEVVVEGLVDYPMTLTVLDMDYMDWVTVTVDHPETGPTEYDGVPITDIFSYVGVQPDAATLILTASDGTSAEIALDDISSDEALLAVDETGAMSAVLPGSDSEAWVEDIVSMRFE